MPAGLKKRKKTGHILYNSAWIVGVDYAHEDAFEADTLLSIHFNSDDEVNKGNVHPNQIMGLIRN